MAAGSVIKDIPAMQGLYIMELATPNSTPWQIIYISKCIIKRCVSE
jgi:hypothetical protein